MAHSLAEICEKYGCLLATRFFWQTAAERSNSTRFVATMASPNNSSRTFARIEAAVDAKFIIEPLRYLVLGFDFKDSPFFIIIDRLGEY